MASGASIATAYVQILPTTKGIESGIAGALSGLGGAGLTAAGGMGLAAGAASTLLSKLNLTTVAAGAAMTALINIGKASVRTGMNFDASMSQVYMLMSHANEGAGLTEEQMKTLRDRAREMGSTTQFTASQVADAMSYMALAGWDADQVYANIPSVLQLAAASNMDLARASDIVTDYMAAFSNTAPEAVELVDLLAYAQASSNSTTEGFAEAWKYSAGMMNTAGQSAATTTAILARLADQGHKGSTAGVELNAVMTQLIKGMDKYGNIEFAGGVIHLAEATENFNPEEYAARVAQLNDELLQYEEGSPAYMAAIERFREELGDPGQFIDIISVLQQMQDILSAQGLEQGSIGYSNALMSFFDNVRGYRGISTILNGDVAELRTFESELESSSGTAGKMATVLNDNLKGDLLIFNSAVDDVKITISDGLTPALRTGTQVATGFVQKFGRLLKGQQLNDGTNSVTSLTKSFGQLSDFDYEKLGERADAMMRKLQNPDLPEEERAELVAGLQEIRDAVAGTDLTPEGENAIEGVAQGMTSYDFTGDGQTIKDSIVTAIDSALQAHSPAQALVPTGENAAAGVGLGMQEYDYSADALAASAAIQAALAAALAIADWVTTSAPIGAGIARGIQAKSATVSSAAGLLITNAKTRMRSLIGSGGAHFKPLGVDIAKGLAQGIRDGSSYVLEAINNLIDAALKGASVEIERGSPSRLFAREIGKPIAQGVGMGIRDNVADPVSALTDTMDTLTRVTAAEFAGAGSMPARGGFTFNQTVNSPKALTPWEVARQARNAARQMAEAMA